MVEEKETQNSRADSPFRGLHLCLPGLLSKGVVHRPRGPTPSSDIGRQALQTGQRVQYLNPLAMARCGLTQGFQSTL